MQILAGSRPLVQFPVTGPAGIDFTQFPVKIAIMPDNGTPPGPADWHAASWVDGQASITIGGTGAALPLAEGFWFGYVQIDTGAELLQLPGGRIRVGDPRQ